MAVNPVQFLVASNASILDGTKTITISGGVNASRVFSGTAVFLGGADNPAEAVSGTAPDGSGISTITLRNNWTQGDVSNQSLVAFNTNEGLAEAISNVREIVSNASALEDLATEGLVKRIDDNNYEVVSITSLGESLVGANDSGTARSVLGLGSAATRDVTTSPADSNETRLMKVSDFGLGERVATSYPISDFDDPSVPCGFYRLINGNPTLGTRPSNFSVFAYCQVQSYDQDSKLQIVVDINGKKAYRLLGGSSPEWIYEYNSKNSVNPLDYGLGGATTTNETDLNTGVYVESGITIISAAVSNMVNKPDDPSTSSRYIVTFDGALDNGVQRVTNRVTGSTWQRAFAPGGTIGDWVELYHSGNSVNPIDYGIGGVNKLPDASSLQGEYENGFYYIPNATSRPSANASNWYLRVENVLNNPDFRKYTASPVNPINGSAAEYTCIKSDGTFTNWERNFTEGNTNFNEFGGAKINALIGKGFAATPDTAVLYFPISSKTPPTGLSVTGTFRLTTYSGNVSTGLGGSDLTLQSVKSDGKWLVVDIAGLNGLTINTPLELRSETSDAKITVNF